MERQEGLLKAITIQFVIVFVMAILLQYVWKEAASVYELAELKFPKSLAIALFLRLWVIIPVLVTNNQSK